MLKSPILSLLHLWYRWVLNLFSVSAGTVVLQIGMRHCLSSLPHLFFPGSCLQHTPHYLLPYFPGLTHKNRHRIISLGGVGVMHSRGLWSVPREHGRGGGEYHHCWNRAGHGEGVVVDLLHQRIGKWDHFVLSGGLRAAHRTSVGTMILQKCHHVTT